MWHTQVRTGVLPGQIPVNRLNGRVKNDQPTKKSVGRPLGSKRKTLGTKWYSELTHAISAWPAMGLMIGD